MDSRTRVSENDSAAHRKGMALKTLIARYKQRSRDAGAGLVDAVVGIGLAAIIIGGPILYFTTVNGNAAGNAATQEQNTAISEALDRTVANIQASDTIIYAGPNELVTRSTEVEEGKADNPVVTRWVLNTADNTLYQQAWSGTAGVAAYSRGSVPSAAGGTADVVTRKSVENLQLDGQLFTYTDKDGADIDVKAPKAALTENARTSPADGKKTFDIALVNIAIKAGTVKDGMVENKTSAAPRSVSGKAGPDVDIPSCPAVDVSTNAANKPVIRWSTMPGYTSYQVTRNGSQVAVVTAAATDAQKSWTDASVVAGPTESVQYRVYARNADGSIASIACMPKVWSPQIAAPEFKNSAVLPAADQAHEWTDGTDGALGLKKPRIQLQWGAVAGATSYELKYRELDPVTGNPLTTGFSAVAQLLPAGTTKFTWDEGGWAASYEWFIKANAGAGQSQSPESVHVTTLTHPPAPQNVDVTPQYGVGSDRMTNGYNVIKWNASPTAVEYDVWRYNSGSSGAVTKLATVKASSALTYKDTVPYGTSWTYYVAAVNDGARGNTSGKASSANPEAGVTTATGTMPTVSYKEPAGGMVMSTMNFSGDAVTFDRVASVDQDTVKPAPQKAAQLQFPPVPVQSSSRDYDGYNHFDWQPALSATGYQVARFDNAGPTGTKECLTAKCADSNGTDGTGGGTTSTAIDDRNVPKGSKFYYAAQAYNATGLSVELSAIEPLTQRPAAPALTVTRTPDESDNTTDFQIIQNADAGNAPVNRFCTKDTCEYELNKTVTTPTTATSTELTVDHSQTGAPWDIPKRSSPEGYTSTFTARSKNEAVTNSGYSDDSTVEVDTLPGNFWVVPTIGDINWGQAHRVKLDKVNMNGPADSNNATTVRWGPSSGAGSITYTRRALSGDTVDGSLGLSPSSAPSGTVESGAQGAGDDTATPGAAYAYDVTATGVNGKTRKISTNPVITPAAISKTGTLQITCAGRDDRAFTEAQLRPGGNYEAGVMSQPYYGQKHSTKLIRSDPDGSWTFDASPAYGKYKKTSYYGIVNGSGKTAAAKQTYYRTGSNYTMTGQWTAAKGDFSSGDGYTYRMYMRNGFQIITEGADFRLPDANGKYATYTGAGSYDLVAYIESMGTFQFNNNCATFNSTGPNMTEPLTPCYAFNGSECTRRDYASRPHWLSK
jgi:hypothetical protein